MPRCSVSRTFATVLRRIVDEEFEGNIAEFARRAKIPQSAASYYTRAGKQGRFPSTDALEKMIQPMKRSSRAEVTIAWLIDRVPKSARGLVGVGKPGKSGLPTPPRRSILLPDATEDAFEDLRKLAAESADIRRWIELTAKSMRAKED